MRASDQVKNVITSSHDKDIFSSKHDEIVVWLYDQLKSPLMNNPVLESILDSNFNPDYGYSQYPWSFINTYGNQIINANKVDVKIEYPLTKRQQEFVIGFSDLFLSVQIENHLSQEDIDRLKISSDYKLYKKCYEDTKWIQKYRISMGIEVKSVVNIGETIRQINYYKMNSSVYNWFVCAPQFPRSELLVEQGIGFIPYTP